MLFVQTLRPQKNERVISWRGKAPRGDEVWAGQKTEGGCAGRTVDRKPSWSRELCVPKRAGVKGLVRSEDCMHGASVLESVGRLGREERSCSRQQGSRQAQRSLP